MQTYQKAARLPLAKTDGGRAGVYFGYGQVYETMGVRSLAAKYYELASKLYGSAGRADEKDAADEALKRVLPGGTLKAHPINLDAELKGGTIAGLTPSGRVEFKVDPDGDRELMVKVTDVNLPAGTMLSILVDGRKVGTFRLRDGKRGKFMRDTGEEEAVPQIGEREQTRVAVTDNKGRTILEGAISGAPRAE